MRIHWPRVSQDSLAYTATLVASTLSQHETRFFSDNVLDDAWKFLVAMALLVGSWIGGVYLEVILWHIGMFNWKRLFNMDPKNGPWWTSFYDEKVSLIKVFFSCLTDVPVPFKKESMNHPQHLPDLQSNNNNNRSMPAWPPAQTVIPVMSGLHQRNVPVFPVTTIGNNDAPAPSPSAAAAAAQGVPFKTVQVMRLNDYNRWHQHLPRNRFENNVRLIAAFGRIIAVCTGFLFAFDSAGINIFSMLASVGILALCFSYGAGSLLGNYFAYVMTLIANKTKRHEWISYAGYQGEPILLSEMLLVSSPFSSQALSRPWAATTWS